MRTITVGPRHWSMQRDGMVLKAEGTAGGGVQIEIGVADDVISEEPSHHLTLEKDAAMSLARFIRSAAMS